MYIYKQHTLHRQVVCWFKHLCLSGGYVMIIILIKLYVFHLRERYYLSFKIYENEFNFYDILILDRLN